MGSKGVYPFEPESEEVKVGGFGRSFGRFGMVFLNPAWIVMIQIPKKFQWQIS